MQFELTKEFIDELIDIIDRNDEVAAVKLISPLHPADIAEIYEHMNLEQAKYLYFLLDKEKAADVIAELEDDDREKFLEELPSEVIAKQFIEEMDSDDAADVLADLSDEKKFEVLSHIDDQEQAGDIVDLLNYDEDTAGGLMAKEFIAVNENFDVNSCIAEIRKQAEEIDEIYNIYVVDDFEKLKGVLSLKKLLISHSKKKIANIVMDDVISVKVDTPGEDVAIRMQKYDLIAIPVVDDIGRLVGKITVDDIVDFIKDEADKDYQMVSGIVQDVETTDKVWHITKARIPWLLIGLVGGILGAQVIGHYEGFIQKYAGLALFLPLIAAMGGNVGVQSSSIIVQGLANQSLGIESTGRKLLKELAVAIIAGIVCSSLILGYNLITSDSMQLTITVSVALFSVIIFASLFGTFVPLMLNRFKIDPALATGPFITTVNDIMGIFLYLIIGNIIFSLF
jgi:magnesium transporter